MMFGVSVVVWLSVMSMASAGNTTPANTLPQSARKMPLQKVTGIKQMIASQHKGIKQMISSHDEGIKQMLTSKLQAVPSSYPVGTSGSSKELWAIESKLRALETKLEVSEANLRATQANLKATQANLKATQADLKATQADLKARQDNQKVMLDETKAKQDATEQQLRSTRASLETLKANRKEGSTFIRWGRKTCSTASSLVYSGVAGGSWWDHPGAASNPLCLTMEPQFEGTRVPGVHALLFGAEYGNDQDVPCSVCRAPQSTTIMIPATHVCPKGWTTQYTGRISAGHYSHKAATQYVCLDRDPENAETSRPQSQDGHLFYYTVTQCGSLPCPPYADNRVVLCVVCSK